MVSKKYVYFFRKQEVVFVQWWSGIFVQNVSKFMSVKMYNLRRKTQTGSKVGWSLLKNTMTKTDFFKYSVRMHKKKFKIKSNLCTLHAIALLY